MPSGLELKVQSRKVFDGQACALPDISVWQERTCSTQLLRQP
jgi:hypothetical protein